jgi:hypothetical protein
VVVTENLRQLQADQWMMSILPELGLVAEFCTFDRWQGRRLQLMVHWLESWYRRSGWSSRLEAERLVWSIAARFQSACKWNRKFIFQIVLILNRLQLPFDLIASIVGALRM